MEVQSMNAVGIDVSKEKSTVAVMKPFGEIVLSPFDVFHTKTELQGLIDTLRKLKGEVRIVIEFIGNYYAPIANTLCKAGFYVSVVNAILVHDYKNNRLRRVKTDKKDAIKLANYTIDSWFDLPRYYIEEDTRLLLKNFYHKYEQYSKLQTMISNNLISLLDMSFPGINRLLASHSKASGEKSVSIL